MIETDKLPDHELGQQAANWRSRALSGDLHARGIAHQLEAELRRRSGAIFTSYDTLHLRFFREQAEALDVVAVLAVSSIGLGEKPL